MLWKKDRLTHRFSVDETELHQLVRSQSNSVAKRARARDGLELTLAALVGFVFFYEGALDLGASEPSLKWEWIVLAFGCWAVSGFFLRERFRSRRTAPRESDTIRESLRRSREAIDRQIHLRKNVLWWYCLPILVPLLLVAIRVDAFRNFRWPYVAVTSAIVVAIVLGNRWYVRAKLVPRRASVEHLLNELEDARA